MFYSKTDKRLAKLKTAIKKAYSRTSAVMKFDEINVIKSVKELYKTLEQLNLDAYLDIANEVYKEHYPDSKKKLDKKWLLLILAGYDPVTKYVYTHEVDRKSARMYEALLSTKTKKKEFDNALNLWWKQTSQYGITITDQAVIQAFKDQGIQYVQWHSKEDDRTCKTCKERNGKYYRIDKIPTKHYQCRCWITKVENKT